MGFRITTWNVNGIRNPFGYQPWREKRTFQAMFDILEADIVIMQETKIQRKDLQDDMVLVPGWDVFFSLPRHKKGYSGVAIYTRNATCAPIRAEEGVTGILSPPKSTTSFRELPKDQQIGGYPRPGQLPGDVDQLTLDSEGRCVVLEFPAFVLLGVYSPANRDESRDDFRLGFLEALDARIRNLVAEGKQVILAGDLNIVRSEMDTSGLAETLRKEAMSMEEWASMPARRLFNQLIFEGAIKGPRDEGRDQPILWDLCRFFHPDRERMNTCWNTKKNTRPANYGSRIDYVLCSHGLKEWFTHANIQEGLMGSDHCPVFATLKDTVVAADGDEVPLLDLVNPPGMFRGGQRRREWGSKDLLPISAKLIPEFDRRRSIREMFTRSAGPSLPRQPSSNAETTTGPPSDPPRRDPSAPRSDGNGASEEVQTASANLGPETGTASGLSPQGQKSLGSKRLAEPTASAGKPQKRSKNSGDASASKTSKVSSGQTTLQGFFKPSVSARTSRREPQRASANTQAAPSWPGNSPAGPAEEKAIPPGTDDATQGPTSPNPAPPPSTTSPGRAIDPVQAVQAHEKWAKLLTKRAAPRCEHNEPCISLVTKKPGVNCGRSFYICSRPLGPSGEKEKGSEWRCGTFIWSSDWSGSPS